MTTPVWIGLGSNLGDRRAIFDAAVQALAQTEGVAVTRVSTYRETLPVGGPPGQGPFLNAAARLDTTLSPRALLAETQRIEADLGRVRVVRWGERTLDIDLLIFGSKFVDEPDLKLPHPRLAVRRFVLEPLAEIAPDVVDTTTRRTVADLLANLDRSPRILMWIDPATPEMPRRVADTLAAPLVKGVDVGPSEFSLGYPKSSMRLLREVLALRGALAKRRDDSSPWLVCDFAFDGPRIWASLSPSPKQFQTKGKWASWFGSDPSQWIRHLTCDLFAGLGDGTLAVALPTCLPDRRSGQYRTPVYQPEATEPATIVAEVAAVCRGIAGV